MFEEGQGARCVNAAGWKNRDGRTIDGPRGGDSVIVVASVQALNPFTGVLEEFLHVERFPGGGYPASAFRPCGEAALALLRSLAAAPALSPRQLAGDAE